MKNNLFQYAILGIMGLFILGGLAAFALYQGGGKQSYDLVVWGEIPEQNFNLLKGYAVAEDSTFSIDYNYKDPRTITNDLTQALSAGTGPDIVLMTADKLQENRNRLLPISYEVVPVSTFESTYLPQLTPLYRDINGFRGIPLLIDPLVLYSNSTLLAQQGIINPPATWQDMGDYIARLTRIDGAGSITQSAIALGTMINIERSKEIITSFLFQSGNPIVTFENQLPLTHLQGGGSEQSDARYIVNHYSQYSDPTRSLYTWNQLLPSDEDEFIAGRLASYVGYGSEAQSLAERNPNMSIVVSRFPQALTSNSQAVYGRIYGYSVTRLAESRYEGALKAIVALTQPNVAEEFSVLQHMAPATRNSYGSSTIQPKSDFKGRDVIYDSALIARGWLDPQPEATKQIFDRMITSVVTGQQEVTDAVQEANRDLKSLIE